jgi:peptide/nickel transport system permease protein
VISLALGLPMGVYAGLRPNSAGAKTIMTGSILGFSLPNFWVGLMLIMTFAVMLPDLLPWWPRLPASGRGATVDVLGVRLSLFTLDGWRHLLLPAITLSLYKGALIVRLARATAREVLPMDYIKFARAKGLSERRIVGVHVLKNILIPIATVSGLEFGQTVAFAVVTETVFSWPGVGKLLIDSILLLDRPVVVAYLVIIVFFFVALNLVVDLLYSVLDPRVRLENRAS